MLDKSILEIKRERIENLKIFINKLLTYITDNNTIKGNIILYLHIFIMLLYVVYVIYLPINTINIFVIILIMFIHNLINIYFGTWNRCILVKLERYFYEDDIWFGPNTPIFKMLGMSDKKYQKNIQFYNLSFWVILYFYYFYRLYKCFFTKSNTTHKPHIQHDKQIVPNAYKDNDTCETY